MQCTLFLDQLTLGLQHKLLVLLIESPNIFHWKSAKKE